MNGTNDREGRVEIFYNGKWGTVCSDHFDIRDAEVICRMMSFPGAISVDVDGRFGAGNSTQKIWLDDLWCSGDEVSVASCSFRRWGSHNCNHNKDVGVICRERIPGKVIITPMALLPNVNKTHDIFLFIEVDLTGRRVYKDVQNLVQVILILICDCSITVIYVELLDGGGYPNQGRVSLYYNGQWGTVCDDEWDINDAHVVCRMLGYPGAVSFTTDSTFGGAQDGPIWLDEVNCTGNENTLAACPHFGWGNSDCDHNEDAGVICDFNYTVDAKGKGDAW